MTLDLATVPRAVQTWPAEDRQALLDHLAGGLEADGGPPLSDELKAELDRRIALYRGNPLAGEPWDVVYARLTARK